MVNERQINVKSPFATLPPTQTIVINHNGLILRFLLKVLRILIAVSDI